VIDPLTMASSDSLTKVADHVTAEFITMGSNMRFVLRRISQPSPEFKIHSARWVTGEAEGRELHTGQESDLK
jgi:hypothetical protein